MKHPFLLLLIHSDKPKDYWRKTARDTWLSRHSQDVLPYFLIEGTSPCKNEEDTIVMPDTLLQNRKLTPLALQCILKGAELNPEWIGIMSDKDYVVLQRMFPYLTEDQNFVGFESERANIHFFRTKALKEVPQEEHTLSVQDSIKKAGYQLFVPPNIAHPIKPPKAHNSVITCLNRRPDKLERVHKFFSKPHVAILTICLGKYDRFFGGWYESTQEYFLPGCTRHYYVWEDSKYPLPYNDLEYCTFIKQENLGYEKNNWYRFKMFLQLKEELKQYDYVFFSQVTGRCTCVMDEKELIPGPSENWFTIARNIDMPNYFTHDEQPNSTARVDKSKARFYAQGGMFGGHPSVFIHMCETCQAEAEENDRRGVVSWLRDESHINKYFFDKNPKQTWLRFWWPPTKEQSAKCHYYTLEKKRYGGFQFLRKPDTDETCSDKK